MRMIKLAVMLAIGLSCFFSGCSCTMFDFEEKARPFGQDYNKSRKELGIATIPEDWKIGTAGRGWARWVSKPEPSRDRIREGVPFRHYKGVGFTEDGKTILRENDLYYSGRRGPSQTDRDIVSSPEQLIIRFNYTKHAEGENPWSWSLLNSPDGEWGKPIEGENLADALRYLEAWGIEHDYRVIPTESKEE